MKNIFLFAISASLLTSCSLTDHYMADDIYVVKPSDLAVGESTADETTYAAFKQRKTGVANDRQVFSDANFGFNNRFSPFGNNYAWFLYTSQFPYAGGSSYFFRTNSSWMGYESWDTHVMFMRGYGWHNGTWNGESAGYGNGPGYCNGYAYYCDGFNNSFGWGGFNGCNGNYGYGGYGYGGNGYVSSNSQNAYSGPRGSTSGYANPNGRKYTSALKSGVVNQTGYSQTGRRTMNTSTSNPVVEKKPIASIGKQQPATRYSSSGTSRTNGTQTANRTYTRTDADTRPSNTTYQSRGSSGSNGRNSISIGTRNNGGTVIQGTGRTSSGNSSSGGGSSTNGSSSGRSSGNSNSGSTGSGGSSKGGNSGGTSGGRRQ